MGGGTHLRTVPKVFLSAHVRCGSSVICPSSRVATEAPAADDAHEPRGLGEGHLPKFRGTEAARKPLGGVIFGDVYIFLTFTYNILKYTL